MERKVPFLENEIYHIYSRGVEKRDIFMGVNDYERFLRLFLLANSTEPIKISNLPKGQRGFPSLTSEGNQTLVSILAYSLMPNHFHILIKEDKAGGISK